MKPFAFEVPGKVVFGRGSVNAQLPGIVKSLCVRKVFIVSGPGAVKRGTTGKIAGLLEDAGFETSVFCDIEANPSAATVNKCAKACTDFGGEAMVVLGGGSPMDTAKAASVVVSFGGCVEDYLRKKSTIPGPTLPIIAIPTTAGTGSEVTSFAVITDTEQQYKSSVDSVYTIPKYAILDSTFMESLPPSVAAATGMDALVHAIEAYVSVFANPYSDALALQAMQLIGANIRAFTANRANAEAADGMLLGSMFAGLAFNNAFLGDVHAMSHPVSAHFGTAHGVANAILLPVVLDYNRLCCPDRYLDIYNCISLTPAPEDFVPEDLAEEVRCLLFDLDIPQTLSEVGVTEDLIPQMAKDAARSGNSRCNPRTATVADFEKLYRQAL